MFVQQEVAKFAETFIEFPPMQKAASFNLDAVKEQVQRAMHVASRAVALRGRPPNLVAEHEVQP